MIWCVEDDVSIRDIEIYTLEQTGFAAKGFCDGDSFWVELATTDELPELVILDIMLPGEDGVSLLKKIKASSRTRDIPVIMATAKSVEYDKIKSLDMGADDYLVKPVDEEELLLHIKAIERRLKIAGDRKITIGSVVLDYDSFTVNVNGEEILLPQKEFKLLYLLLSNPGRIYTRIQLMDEIWGTDTDTGWETVTVHIGRLRKRFENIKEFEIVSVRGLGYKAVKKV